MNPPPRDTRTGFPACDHLTDAGVKELGSIFPEAKAVFVQLSCDAVSDAALQAAFPNTPCVLLGREITAAQYYALQASPPTYDLKEHIFISTSESYSQIRFVQAENVVLQVQIGA